MASGDQSISIGTGSSLESGNVTVKLVMTVGGRDLFQIISTRKDETFGSVKQTFAKTNDLNPNDIFLKYPNVNKLVDDKETLGANHEHDVVLCAEEKVPVTFELKSKPIKMLVSWPLSVAALIEEIRKTEFDGAKVIRLQQVGKNKEVLKDDKLLDKKQLSKMTSVFDESCLRIIVVKEITVKLTSLGSLEHHVDTGYSLNELKTSLIENDKMKDADKYYFCDEGGEILHDDEVIDNLIDVSATELSLQTKKKMSLEVKVKEGDKIVKNLPCLVNPLTKVSEIAKQCELSGDFVFINCGKELQSEKSFKDCRIKENDVISCYHIFDINFQIEYDEGIETKVSKVYNRSNRTVVKKVFEELSSDIDIEFDIHDYSLVCHNGTVLSCLHHLVDLPKTTEPIRLTLLKTFCEVNVVAYILDDEIEETLKLNRLWTLSDSYSLIETTFTLGDYSKMEFWLGNKKLLENYSFLAQGVGERSDLKLYIYYPVKVKISYENATRDVDVDTSFYIGDVLKKWLKEHSPSLNPYAVLKDGKYINNFSQVSKLIVGFRGAARLTLSVEKKSDIYFKFEDDERLIPITLAATPRSIDEEVNRVFQLSVNQKDHFTIEYAQEEDDSSKPLHVDKSFASQGVTLDSVVRVNVVYNVKIKRCGEEGEVYTFLSSDSIACVRRGLCKETEYQDITSFALLDKNGAYLRDAEVLRNIITYFKSNEVFEVEIDPKKRIVLSLNGGLETVPVDLPLHATPNHVASVMAAACGFSKDRQFRLKYRDQQLWLDDSFAEQSVGDGETVEIEFAVGIRITNNWDDSIEVVYLFIDQAIGDASLEVTRSNSDVDHSFYYKKSKLSDLTETVGQVFGLSDVTPGLRDFPLHMEVKREGYILSSGKISKYSGYSHEELNLARQRTQNLISRRERRFNYSGSPQEQLCMAGQSDSDIPLNLVDTTVIDGEEPPSSPPIQPDVAMGTDPNTGSADSLESVEMVNLIVVRVKFPRRPSGNIVCKIVRVADSAIVNDLTAKLTSECDLLDNCYPTFREKMIDGNMELRRLGIQVDECIVFEKNPEITVHYEGREYRLHSRTPTLKRPDLIALMSTAISEAAEGATAASYSNGLLSLEFQCARCRRLLLDDDEQFQEIPANCCSTRSLELNLITRQDARSQCTISVEECTTYHVYLSDGEHLRPQNQEFLMHLCFESGNISVLDLRRKVSDKLRMQESDNLILNREEGELEGRQMTEVVKRLGNGERNYFFTDDVGHLERNELVNIRKLILQDEESIQLRQEVGVYLFYERGQKSRLWINCQEDERIITALFYLPVRLNVKELREILKRVYQRDQESLSRRQKSWDGQLVLEGASRGAEELIFLAYKVIEREGETIAQNVEWQQVGGKPDPVCLNDEDEVNLLLGEINVFTYLTSDQPREVGDPPRPEPMIDRDLPAPATLRHQFCNLRLHLQYYNCLEQQTKPMKNEGKALELKNVRLPSKVRALHRILAKKLNQSVEGMFLSRRETGNSSRDCRLQECLSMYENEKTYFPDNMEGGSGLYSQSKGSHRPPPRRLTDEEDVIVSPSQTNVFVVTNFDPSILPEVQHYWRFCLRNRQRSGPDHKEFFYAQILPDDLGLLRALELKKKLALRYGGLAEYVILYRNVCTINDEPYHEAFCECLNKLVMVTAGGAVQRTGVKNLQLTEMADHDLLLLSPEHANVIEIDWKRR